MPFVKPQKSFISKILTQQHVLFNILCDTTEVQGKEHIFCSLAMAVLRKSTCMTELWAGLGFFFLLRGRGESFFFLGKTDKQWLFRLGDLACSQKWKKWNSHCKKNWPCLLPVVKFDLSSQNWILENSYLASWASQHSNS